jgi:hypothetical protein
MIRDIKDIVTTYVYERFEVGDHAIVVKEYIYRDSSGNQEKCVQKDYDLFNLAGKHVEVVAICAVDKDSVIVKLDDGGMFQINSMFLIADESRIDDMRLIETRKTINKKTYRAVSEDSL